jgi:hypothetical protein
MTAARAREVPRTSNVTNDELDERPPSSAIVIRRHPAAAAARVASLITYMYRVI